MSKLTDESIMTFGKYKGKELQYVPANYLLWCYDINKLPPQFREYVEDNMDVLLKKTYNITM